MLAGLHYMVGGPYGFQQALVIVDGDKITVADLDGELLIEHSRPAPGVTYVGNGKPRGPRPRTPTDSSTSAPETAPVPSKSHPSMSRCQSRCPCE